MLNHKKTTMNESLTVPVKKTYEVNEQIKLAVPYFGSMHTDSKASFCRIIKTDKTLVGKPLYNVTFLNYVNNNESWESTNCEFTSESNYWWLELGKFSEISPEVFESAKTKTLTYIKKHV
jgi:hypothetical protein